MNKAGPLIYGAYQLFQTAATDVEATNEGLRVNMDTGNAGSNIASSQMMLQQGVQKFEEGKKLKDEAENEFQASADPLGPPPEETKSWGEVDAMARRATTKMHSLKESITEVQKNARHAHISLISVASEKAIPVESWGRQQDDKLLDFLAKQ